MYDLVCRTSFRAHRLAIQSGTAGIGLPISGSFTNDDYTYFTTRRPVNFPDFDHTRATITSSSAGLYSWNTVKIFDKNGNQLAHVITSGFGLSIPELASGGEGRTEIYYGNGQPVETPEWLIDLKPTEPPQRIDRETVFAKDYSVLELPSDLLFDFGKYNLKWAAVEYLAQAGLLIIEKSDVYVRILVEGHTDSVGGSSFNKDLSLKRASAVQKWLEEFVGSSPRLKKPLRWQVIGHGEDKPVASNARASGRTKNRRVQLVLFAR